jgi:hypothetical protein
MKSLVPALVVAIFMLTQACEAELILDSDFEQSTSLSPVGPWTSFGIAKPDEDAPGIDASVEGSETLKLNGDSDTNVFSGVFQDIAVDGVNLKPSYQVELAGIVGHLSSDPIVGLNEAYFEITFVDSMGAEFGELRSVSIDANSATDQYFELQTVAGFVPASASAVRVKAVFVQPNAAVGAAWFDNMSLIVAVPEPNSAILFSVAVFLGMHRRRQR